MFSDDLKRLIDQGLLRTISDRERTAQEKFISPLAHVNINRTECINFASNDYLGLSASPILTKAAEEALKSFPFGAGASRLLSGGTMLHALLEETAARFKCSESALVFNSGYQANVSCIAALARDGDVIFSDELNHASIVDGCRLSKAKKRIYRHCDADHLAALIKEEKSGNKFVVTDTVFSMDGDIAPVNNLYTLCKSLSNTILYLDDAHGTGVLGGGRGALAHFGLRPEPWIVQMGTFSKALGSFGAFVAGSREVINWLINTARGLIYSTALPPGVIAASLAAITTIAKDSSFNVKLWQNHKKAVEGISEAGFKIICKETPILAVTVGDIAETLAFSDKLWQRHIYAPAIRPPTVKTPRLRITVSAAHSDEDIYALIQAVNDCR
ncbi:MAG TPA: 8-amino-7-oxononanoate synthase [Dissulfurispiraceae bacterium]|nr:8-amino-7-oxononanoate synthase [Dissulfurispiraceae bacterium]